MHQVYPSENEVLMDWSGSGRSILKERSGESIAHCEFVEAERDLQMLLYQWKATGLVRWAQLQNSNIQ